MVPLGNARRSADRPLGLFASDAPDFVNGQVLYVDGGMTAVV